jgi:hypothetical protein
MSVTFKDLINRTKWAVFEEKFLYFYPEEEEIIKWYKQLFWKLSNLDAAPNPNNLLFDLELYTEDEFEEEFFDYEDVYEEEFHDYNDAKWSEFLGYYIPFELLEELDEAEILVHIFYELTYNGANE